jgi:hypothetical protein
MNLQTLWQVEGRWLFLLGSVHVLDMPAPPLDAAEAAPRMHRQARHQDIEARPRRTAQMGPAHPERVLEGLRQANA